MIRAVLAVVVAAALLAAALPAVDSVRTNRTAATMERSVDRLERAGSDLLANDAADAGARRVVTVTLSARSLAAAGIDRFVVSCASECLVRYRLADRRTRSHRVRSIPLATPDGPVRFSTPGTHRLVLGLAEENGSRVVTVRGEYQRFALRAPSGGPDGGGAVVRYVRDGSTATLDVDGDGDPEELGRSERISFETETTVVAAVPPGPPGVGDVDGTRTEQSPGWPCPGATGDDEGAGEQRCTGREAE